ncbi:MAG: aminopeptidase P N-terminal domain-containing protein [Epsilonproteobacteria bacterium]|nr:aminopeptidase P N-terminal domain-containing protein [Campylobacterota bacterium]
MITQKEFYQRRQKFAKKMADNSLAVFVSSKPKIRSNDTEYPYRQDSNFYYLTGFKEDNAALLFIKRNKKVKVVLFVEKKDPKMELWTGKRVGVKRAKKEFIVDAVQGSDTFCDTVLQNSDGIKCLYYDLKVEDTRIQELQKQLSPKLLSYKDGAKIAEAMRLIKSPAEIKLIKKALGITKKAHHRAMKLAQKLSYEYELQAEFEYIFTKKGAYSDAYTTIVASGDNANTLHYINNDKPLKSGEMILIDAGCEYEYYASDITRTIPKNGKFTKEQKELYEVVLDVQKKIINMMKPGVLRSDLQKESERLLCEAMVQLGILKGDVKKLLKKQKHKKYYPHGIGHYMGLDVHDQNPYKDKKGKEIPLQAGMVLTIEPGIYLPKDDKKIPKKYRGIGIRIEDNILVTKKGYKNLSSGIIKEVEDIEAYALSCS